MDDLIYIERISDHSHVLHIKGIWISDQKSFLIDFKNEVKYAMDCVANTLSLHNLSLKMIECYTCKQLINQYLKGL